MSTRETYSRGLGAAVVVTAVASIASLADAGTVVAPNAYALQGGTAVSTALLHDLPRTYQMIVNATHLSSVPVGALITGIQWRADDNAALGSWPSTDRTWTEFNMWLAPAAVSAANMSTTFASNVGAGEQLVLSGPLTIAANSFTSLGTNSVNPWGPTISFDSAYVYTGGDLVFTARHAGFNEDGQSVLNLDGLSNSTAVANGTRAMIANASAATTGSSIGYTISQFTFEVPAPGAAGVLGLGALIVARRRR